MSVATDHSHGSQGHAHHHGHLLSAGLLTANEKQAAAVQLTLAMIALSLLALGIAWRWLAPDEEGVSQLLLAAASLFGVSRILRLSPSFSAINWGPLVIWAAAVVTVLPMHVFAQREHMAMLTVLPALAVYAMRSQGEIVSARMTPGSVSRITARSTMFCSSRTLPGHEYCCSRRIASGSTCLNALLSRLAMR